MGVIWKYVEVFFVLFRFLIVTAGILLAFRVLRLLNELQFTGKDFITGYPTQNANIYSILEQTKLDCTAMDKAEQTLPNNSLSATARLQLTPAQHCHFNSRPSLS